MHVQLIERFIRMVNYSPDECAFMAEIEIELLNILEPKLKSVLQQTSLQNRDDLEQELKIIVLKKIKGRITGDLFDWMKDYYEGTRKQRSMFKGGKLRW